jgi:hypothetical protein
MSEDMDDLLERAARAEERDVPTLDELKDELARALDELEERFPDGRPERNDSNPWASYRYGTLMMRILRVRDGIECGSYSETPRSPRAVPSAQWQAFLDEHPELVEREPLTFTDAQLLRALRKTHREWNRRFKDRRKEGVLSSSVAWVLAGLDAFSRGPVSEEDRSRRPSRRDVTRVGVALARLAREGRVIRTNRSWEANAWRPAPKGG